MSLGDDFDPAIGDGGGQRLQVGNETPHPHGGWQAAYPLSIGGGLRLFDDNLELKKFGLKQSRVIDNGVLILEYLPIG